MIKGSASVALKVLIAGGGTGGHLYPGIALAREILRRDRAAAILFVGTASGLESQIVPKAGFDLATIRMSGWKGLSGRSRLQAVLVLPGAVRRSGAILRCFGPHAVVGLGGYASAPVILAAWLSRCPAVLQEQNSIPGMTNRLLVRFVRRVYTAYEQAADYFPREKVVRTGNPLREGLTALARGPARAYFGLHRDTPTVLILGGSRGAAALNRVARELVAAPGLVDRPVQFLHQTGAAEFEAVRLEYEKAGVPAEVRPFFDEMGAAYSAADLTVSRAGAVVLSELCVTGLPAILIPFPFAADDHQRRNAQVMVEAGAAELLAQEQLDAGTLWGRIRTLLDAPERLAAMRDAARRQAQPDAARRLVDDLERLTAARTP